MAAEDNGGRLALALGLVDKAEGETTFDTVKDVEAPAKGDAPAVVGFDHAVMLGLIESIGEGDFLGFCALLDLVEFLGQFDLFDLGTGGGSNPESDVFILGFENFDEAHEVVNLVVEAKVGVNECYVASVPQIGTEQTAEGNAGLSFMEVNGARLRISLRRQGVNFGRSGFLNRAFGGVEQLELVRVGTADRDPGVFGINLGKLVPDLLV